MKYLLFFVFTLFAIGCIHNCACKMGAANVETIQGMNDAFGEEDVEAVVAAMTSDIQWNEAENFVYADINPYVGPDAVA